MLERILRELLLITMTVRANLDVSAVNRNGKRMNNTKRMFVSISQVEGRGEVGNKLRLSSRAHWEGASHLHISKA